MAQRLREQAERLGVQHNLIAEFPKTDEDLRLLEAEIQTVAKRLAISTGIIACSLEELIGLVENYGHGYRRVGPWQI